MKFTKKVMPFLMVLSGMILTLSGCEGVSSHQGVMDIVSVADKPVEKGQVSTVIPPQPLVLVKAMHRGNTFFTQTRKDKMERFQCSSCHIGMENPINEAREVVHGNIILNHGAVKNQNACDTCHSLAERDFLAKDSTVKIDFNHSYELCGSCHFRQKKDWIGGAHGKRVQNWAGKRVVQNCVSCHNPHSPRFEKRWPTTFSRSDNVLPADDNH